MDCREIHERLRNHDARALPDVQAHLVGCAACAQLVADEGALARALAPDVVPHDAAPAELESMLGAIQGDIAREQGWQARVRELPTPIRIGIAASVALLPALLALAFGGRADMGVYPLARMLLIVALFVVIAIGAVALGLQPLYARAVPPGLRPALILAAVWLPFILGAIPAAHLDHPASLAGGGADLVPRALRCFAFGMFIPAIPLTILTRFLDRDGHASLVRALLCASAAGLAANLILQVDCPITHPLHLLLGHATIAIVLVAAYGGVGLARTFLAQR